MELVQAFVNENEVVAKGISQNMQECEEAGTNGPRIHRVWDVLEEVIKEHPVMLNRAPTLHETGRLGI